MEENMQLGIRLHDTKKLPFEERIANVHELGFACGHLAPGKVISEFPTTDEALTPGLAMYMKNVFAKNQVDVAVLGCYLNLANPNPACENYPPLYGTYPFCFLAGLRCRGN
jgi:sugar phosphate isomerase/epimerase